MEAKERQRSKQLEMVREGKKTLKAASESMGVSYRQGKRLYKAYRERGDAGLMHGNNGKASNNRIAEEKRRKIIEVYRAKYCDFGPTFASEKMAEEEKIVVNAATLRNILMESGDWQRKRRSKSYRSRRERRARFGELIQFDGSHHDWFEGRRSKCCLITMIDDATNIRYAQMFEQETIVGAMTVFSSWIKKYGIPESLYCDKKNAFVLTREPTDAELLKGITEPKSHFGRSCEKIGVEVIAANSPQAKGRVERNHGTDQDRLVKELRLAGISSIEDANRFLETYYLPKMNEKFSRPSAERDDAHVPLGEVSLTDIFCFEYERKTSNDYVIRFQNSLFQILKTNPILPRTQDTILVRVLLDGSIHFYWNNTKLLVKEITNTYKAIHSKDVA